MTLPRPDTTGVPDAGDARLKRTFVVSLALHIALLALIDADQASEQSPVMQVSIITAHLEQADAAANLPAHVSMPVPIPVKVLVPAPELPPPMRPPQPVREMPRSEAVDVPAPMVTAASTTPTVPERVTQGEPRREPVLMLAPHAAGPREDGFKLAQHEPTPGPAPEPVWHEIRHVDTPPRARGEVRPLYPASAKLREVQGYVKLRVSLDELGRVSDVTTIESEPAGVFDDAARKALLESRFHPAMKDNKPVRIRFEQRVTFRLD